MVVSVRTSSLIVYIYGLIEAYRTCVDTWVVSKGYKAGEYTPILLFVDVIIVSLSTIVPQALQNCSLSRSIIQGLFHCISRGRGIASIHPSSYCSILGLTLLQMISNGFYVVKVEEMDLFGRQI